MHAKNTGNNPVEGVRYVDDLTAFIYYVKNCPESLASAKQMAEIIQYGYHKNMELEVEDTSLPFKFLSSMMNVCKESGQIAAAFYNKNYEKIVDGLPQAFPTYQHYDSFAPAQQKFSVVVSTLHRIGTSSNSQLAVKSAFNTLCSELHLLKYPYAVIKRALNRVRGDVGDGKAAWSWPPWPQPQRQARERQPTKARFFNSDLAFSLARKTVTHEFTGNPEEIEYLYLGVT